VLSTIDGPIVLVGHSYGGMVITNAATGLTNVKALVYVAAYAPDAGDTIATLGALAPGGMIGPPTLDFRTVPAPDGTTTTVEGLIKPSVFHKIFAADLSPRETVPMAAEQRPLAVSALGEPSGPPAWKTIRSWYVLPTKDLAIGTAAERIMARRIGATTISVPGASHVVMMSRPARVASVIERAAR
jgi:pimeloyl-ACP methyl ester carboxylesterase